MRNVVYLIGTAQSELRQNNGYYDLIITVYEEKYRQNFMIQISEKIQKLISNEIKLGTVILVSGRLVYRLINNKTIIVIEAKEILIIKN